MPITPTRIVSFGPGVADLAAGGEAAIPAGAPRRGGRSRGGVRVAFRGGGGARPGEPRPEGWARPDSTGHGGPDQRSAGGKHRHAAINEDRAWPGAGLA